MKFNINPTPLITAIKEYEDKDLIINEEYQRNYVWNDNTIKSELIRSLVSDYPIGTFIFWNTENELGFRVVEIVDGQQRITTINEFIKGKFTLNIDICEKLLNDHYNEIKREAQVDAKAKILFEMIMDRNVQRLGYKDLPKIWVRRLENYTLNVVSVSGDIDEIKDYFSSVQNQERLKAGELINSFPDNPVSNYIQKELIEKFSEIISFNDTRQDILKQLNAIMCIDSKLIRMGVIDKDIIKAVGKLEKDHITNNSRLLEIFDKIIKDIVDANTTSRHTLRVFGLKLLILTYYYLDDLECFKDLPLNIKAEKMSLIADYVGYFNSKDINRKNEIPEEIRDNVQNIWTISKTTHSGEEVEINIKDNLSKIIKYIL